eukprot:scaffold226591_cov36-Tisochrysis_lutea.AAC.2
MTSRTGPYSTVKCSGLRQRLASVLPLGTVCMLVVATNLFFWRLPLMDRWNSIIRKSTHPSGRPWKPSENAVREQVLTAARVAQNQRHDPSALRVRKRERICRLEGTGEIGVSDEELEGDAEPNEAGPHDFDVRVPFANPA